MTHEPWMERGRCREVDPELFYPEHKGANATHAAYKNAVKICSLCEVRSQCYDVAWRNNEQFGIWGGHYALQIRRAKRRKERES